MGADTDAPDLDEERVARMAAGAVYATRRLLGRRESIRLVLVTWVDLLDEIAAARNLRRVSGRSSGLPRVDANSVRTVFSDIEARLDLGIDADRLHQTLMLVGLWLDVDGLGELALRRADVMAGRERAEWSGALAVYVSVVSGVSDWSSSAAELEKRLWDEKEDSPRIRAAEWAANKQDRFDVDLLMVLWVARRDGGDSADSLKRLWRFLECHGVPPPPDLHAAVAVARREHGTENSGRR